MSPVGRRPAPGRSKARAGAPRRAAAPGGGVRARGRESEAARKARAAKIFAKLEDAYPDADIELHFRTPLELLVATILSAQCTDERVNVVTPELFARYRTAAHFADADPATLEREIHSTGFFRAKTRSLIGMAPGPGRAPRRRGAARPSTS